MLHIYKALFEEFSNVTATSNEQGYNHMDADLAKLSFLQGYVPAHPPVRELHHEVFRDLFACYLVESVFLPKTSSSAPYVAELQDSPVSSRRKELVGTHFASQSITSLMFLCDEIGDLNIFYHDFGGFTVNYDGDYIFDDGAKGSYLDKPVGSIVEDISQRGLPPIYSVAFGNITLAIQKKNIRLADELYAYNPKLFK